MSNLLERNKEPVTAFYDLMFNRCDPRVARLPTRRLCRPSVVADQCRDDHDRRARGGVYCTRCARLASL
jgi:hypothetical protein